MPTDAVQSREPEDAGCVDETKAVEAADAKSGNDSEPEFEEVETGGGAGS